TRVLLPFVVSAFTLLAQSDRGTITGLVTDEGSAAIAAASVTATHLETNTRFKATSNENGEFTMPSLAVGVHRVVLEKPGFKTAVHEKVRIEAGSVARLDTKLEVGAVQQSIQVSAEASQLQSDDAKIQNTMSDIMIEGLPTVVAGNMRSPFDLAA